jgi:hypothetical protein
VVMTGASPPLDPSSFSSSSTGGIVYESRQGVGTVSPTNLGNVFPSPKLIENCSFGKLWVTLEDQSDDEEADLITPTK